MSKTANRGRPRSPNPLSPAQRMRIYRARRRASGLKVERRWVPSMSVPAGVYSDHMIKDARSLALHCLIARRIVAEPALLQRAKGNLARWKSKHSDNAPAWLDEWGKILTQPLPRILALITELSEKATRLRQSSPFAGILTPDERKRVYDAFRA